MKRITFEEICEHLWKNYGGSAIARLETTGGSIVPRTYIHYSSNTIFTMDIKNCPGHVATNTLKCKKK